MKTCMGKSISNKYRIKRMEIIHLTCFKTILDNHIIWLQYRKLHNILRTKALLYKMTKAENNLCRFCNNKPETITHVFVDCLYSTKIWDLLKNWIYQEMGSTFDIDKKSILLRFQGHSAITSKNATPFIAKSYLFKCHKESRKPSFNALQLNIKRVFDEQLYLYAITCYCSVYKKLDACFKPNPDYNLN